ncbi:hypothetical protein EUGRSUZ_H01024 [Eucalyptus grandis]|uniref:Uncharacterized protein n=2 Tax=Eucalyptus grandis TaxID=71139 RepID=A0ACC3JMU1_EUCGR|nr:hypothetical protein EUGRSUZ_H01024 [Eucalyptus grandis]
MQISQANEGEKRHPLVQKREPIQSTDTKTSETWDNIHMKHRGKETKIQSARSRFATAINTSALKQVCRCHYGLYRTWDLPGLHQRVGYLGNINRQPTDHLHDLEHRVQGPEPVGKLHGLGPEDIVCQLDLGILLRSSIDTRHELSISLLQLPHFSDQIPQLLLPPHPGAPGGFPVGLHPLPLPFIIGHPTEPRVAIGS